MTTEPSTSLSRTSAAIELLTLLIRCEETDYPVPTTDAVSVVRFLIEQQGLTQRDLVQEFGSESAVSMFLARRYQKRSEAFDNDRISNLSNCLFH